MSKRLHIRRALLSLALAIAASCCVLASCSSKPADTPKSWTLLVYLCGSTLETQTGAGGHTLDELIAAEIPDDVNVVVQTGGAAKWRSHEVPADKLVRWRIDGNGLAQVEALDDASMGDPSTLASFLEWGRDNYPAEHTALVLWDHGGGSQAGVCFDERHGMDALTMGELDKALCQAGVRYEFIGMDACFMAGVDTVDAVDSYASHLIASEETEPTGGWDYKKLVESLGEESFYADVLDAYAAKNSAVDTATLSAIDLSQASKILDTRDALVTTAQRDKQRFGNLLDDVTAFGENDPLSGYTDLYDLGELAKAMDVRAEYTGAVRCANGSARTAATGVSLYVPIHNRDAAADYMKATSSPDYAKFLDDYFELGESSAIELADKGHSVGDRLRFSVAESALPFISGAYYELFQITDGENEFEEHVYGVGTDTDVGWNGASCAVDFEGRWVFFGGHVLCASVAEESAGYTRYFAQVKVNGRPGHLIFTYDENRTIRLEGFAEDTGLISRVEPLKDGDAVTILYREVSDDYHSLEFSDGASFVYDSAVHAIEVRELPAGYYQYYAVVTDIFGNTASSNMAVVHYVDGRITDIIVAEGENELVG